MFNTYIFASGLRLITIPMQSTKTVTVLVLVGTGSKYETKEINGISHFLEHMMFKGTTKHPGTLEITQELDAIGAEYNAFTSKEYTGYYVKASSENIDLILDIISDIFQNSKLDEEEINREKGVIIEEINMYLDTPTRYIHDLFDELLYGDQPAGWPVAGTKEIISKLKREDFVNYFSTHYLAQNTIVAVAGEIAENSIKGKIEKYFNNIRDSQKVEKLKVIESQNIPQAKIFYKKTDQTHFSLGVRAFNLFDKRLEALTLLTVILGAGMSSRLWIKVRERQGLAYYIRAGNDVTADTGYLTTHAGVDNKRVERAVETILQEYKKLKAEPVPAQELGKAKKYIRGKTVIGLESSDDMASFFADQWLLENKTLTPEEKLAKIDKVTVKDIQEVANEIFKPEKLNFALIGPFEDKEQFDKLLKI